MKNKPFLIAWCITIILLSTVCRIALSSVTPKIASKGDPSSNYSLVLKSDGTMWSWGSNTVGELGNETGSYRTTPAQIKSLFNNIIDIACGGAVTLALKSTGTVWQWGNGLGYTPKRFNDLSNITAIAGGEHHRLALKSDGTICAWGSNEYGQLGNGTTTNSYDTPVNVSELNNVIAIAAGGGYSMALKSDGTVWTWGSNMSGQLGSGSGTDTVSLVPVQIKELNNITAIATAGGNGGGFESCLALKSDGTVWAWGDNWGSQLGDGTKIDRNAPVQSAGGMDDVIAIVCGVYYSLVLREDNTIWGWGINWGIFGDSIENGQTAYDPIKVNDLNNIVSIACGPHHAIALQNDGTVWTWGNNESGQLGNGTTTDSNTPVQVDINLYETETPTPTPIASPSPIPSSSPIATGSVNGKVVDALTGNPIAGATVTTDPGEFTTTTDENGDYLLNITAGDYVFTVTALGYETATESVTVVEGQFITINFALLPEITTEPIPTPSATSTPEPNERGSISGNIINMRGYPIESAKIRLKGIKTKILRKTTSDEDGLFEITDLEEDAYILRVLKKRYKSFKQVIELHKGEDLDIEIEMIRGRL